MSTSSQDWTNPAMNGVRVRINWNDVEKKKGTLDWSAVDSEIANAKANNKQIGLSLSMLNDTAFPSDLGAKVYTLTATGSGNAWKIVLPWDEPAKSRILAFIPALCAHVDGKVTYLVMGGLGDNIESYITPVLSDIGLSETDAIAKWTSSCNAIIDAHAAGLKQTPFIMTAAKPFTQASDSAMAALVRAAAAKYPLFGVMDASLKATSDTRYTPHALVKELSGNHVTGLQFVTSSAGFGGHDLDGTLEETLTAAINLGAHFVEAYPADTKVAANAQAFKDAAAKLAK